MAFVTNDDDDDPTILSEVFLLFLIEFPTFIMMTFYFQDSSITAIPKSFITMHVTDPFSTAMEDAHEEYPNAKRNLLEAINNAELTMLPPPPQKENLAVFLR